jgi:hypothetical protein
MPKRVKFSEISDWLCKLAPGVSSVAERGGRVVKDVIISKLCRYWGAALSLGEKLVSRHGHSPRCFVGAK